MPPEGIPATAMFEPRHLRHIPTVAEDESFSQAAPRLHIGQSALSRRVQDLESILGVPLFERTARGIALTPAGGAFVKDARDRLHGHRRAATDALTCSPQAVPNRSSKGSAIQENRGHEEEQVH